MIAFYKNIDLYQTIHKRQNVSDKFTFIKTDASLPWTKCCFGGKALYYFTDLLFIDQFVRPVKPIY